MTIICTFSNYGWSVNYFFFIGMLSLVSDIYIGFLIRLQDETLVGMTSEAREWYRKNARTKDELSADDEPMEGKLKPNSEAFKTHPFGILYGKWYRSAMTNFKAFKEQGNKKANVKDSDFAAYTRPIRFSTDETNAKLIELFESLKKDNTIFDNFRDKKYHVS